FSGVLEEIVAQPEDVIPVGEPLCYMTTEAEDLLGDMFDEPAAPAAAEPDEPAEPVGGPPVPSVAEATGGVSVPVAVESGNGAPASTPAPSPAAALSSNRKPVTMPKMSMTMEEGTMAQWFKQPGDTVTAGEPICEVETDKVEMEVEAPFSGVLEEIVAQPEDVIPVGEPLCYMTTEAEDLLGDLFDEPAAPALASAGPAVPSAAEAQGGVSVPVAVESQDASPAPAPAAVSSNAEPGTTREIAEERAWPVAVPAARRLAAETGVDLARVRPTGPWSTVRVPDVEAAARPQAAAPVAAPPRRPAVAVPQATTTAPTPPTASSPQQRTPRTEEGSRSEIRRRRLRKQTAKVMTASAQIPQFTVYADLDLTGLDRIRKTELQGAGWTAILLKAQALALRTHHSLNAYWSDEGLVPNADVGIALAVDTDNGLLAPVLRNPDNVPLLELDRRIRGAAADARRGSLKLEQLQGGTAVLSNLGGFGITSFNALLTPPQSTALSLGSIEQRIVVGENGTFGARLLCTVGLTADHRTADGADAARFIATLRSIIGDPTRLGAVV
ncbi:dihydrolipoamide acetyltransferase family protein, partial [Kocuria sp. M1R5S2]|uniref:dihydrolipoamide acetyltransferase family protein n=1 Tax=Kocuria rhizosphaerae TaxID=3376285 RepID=UPI0037890BFE